MAGFCVAGIPVIQPPAPGPVPPAPTASTVVLGIHGSGNSFSGPPGNIVANWNVLGVPTLEVGDVLVAVILVAHDIHGTDVTDFTAGLPAGWTLVRNDPNPGNPANHGPMYVGLATRIVDATDAGSPTYNFSISAAGGTHNGGSVVMAAARNSLGIEAVSAAQIAIDTNGKITAPSVATAHSIELVFAAGIGVGFGGNTWSSDDGHPQAMCAVQLNPEGLNLFYYFSTGTTAPATGLTESHTGDNDAANAYHISMLPGPP